LILGFQLLAAEVESPSPSFELYRGPVLGFAVEKAQGMEETYRLVEQRDGRAGEAIQEGSLESCERRLVAMLKERYGEGYVNLVTGTFGGKQVWADEFIYAGWRIQRQVYTHHFRLLDDRDQRRAWGTREACRTVFEEERLKKHLRPASDHWVILLHGLFRSKDCWSKMEQALRAAGYEVVLVNYPSTRASIKEHADQLESVLDAMEGAKQVSFVTHSLGGLVVRDALNRASSWKDRVRLDRVVMLGPPNRGSLVATVMKDWLPYQLVAGDAGQELTVGALAELSPPPCEFGIVAGGKGDAEGYNPLLPGDDDGTVCVEYTQLPEMTDFRRVPCLHSFLMEREEVIQWTLEFLRQGAFSKSPDETGG